MTQAASNATAAASGKAGSELVLAYIWPIKTGKELISVIVRLSCIDFGCLEEAFVIH